MVCMESRWEPSKVVEFIEACRSRGGVPLFKTAYGGTEFRDERGRPVVLAVCWGANGQVPSIKFTDVPEEDLSLIKETVGEWRLFLVKYKKR